MGHAVCAEDLLKRNHQYPSMRKLPQSWRRIPLGDLVVINPIFVEELSNDATVSFLPMRDIEEETGKANLVETRLLNEVRKGYTPFKEKDVVFAKITPCMENGKIAIIGKLTNGQGFGSNELYIFRPLPSIFNRYILYFLLQKSFREEASYEMTGAVGQKRVPRRWLEDYKLPIPPINEQKRIIKKLEELFATLNAGVKEASSVVNKCDLYRRKVLKDAFTGALSREWRKRNTPIGESSKSLLVRILNQRKSHWIDDQLTKFIARRTKDNLDRPLLKQTLDFARDRITSKYQEPRNPANKGLISKPEEWLSVTAEQLGIIQLGRQRAPHFVSKNYPTKYIRAANITETGLDLSDLLEMEFTPEERRIFRLQHGDILISEASGSPDQVGKPAMWRKELPLCCFQNTVIRIRPIIIDPEFLLICLKYVYASGGFAKLAGGIGINHLSAGKFSLLELPLPPLDEQKHIAATVDSLLRAATAAKKDAHAVINAASKSREHILAQAYSGKLLPQIQGDASVDILVEKLKQERRHFDREQLRKRKAKMKLTKKKPEKKQPIVKKPDACTSLDQKVTLTEKVAPLQRLPKTPTLTLKKFTIDGNYNSLSNLNLDFSGGSPICLAGLNGSGKSNLIEALGEAFCQTELEHVPFGSKKGVKNSHFGYRVTYLLSDADTEFEVSLLKTGKKETSLTISTGGHDYLIKSADAIFQKLLP